jgi:hypothetical protein
LASLSLSSAPTLPMTKGLDPTRRRREPMMTRIRQHASYANVMATIAVFLALGGTGYALSLPRNSVGTAQPLNSRRMQ